MKKSLYIIIPVAICFIVGAVSSVIQQESLSQWYPMLDKPDLMPPGYVFGIAWSVIYLLMGISIGIIYRDRLPERQTVGLLFSVQLLLNFTWSIMFFHCKNPVLGFLNIILLDLAVVYYTFRVYPVKKLSSALFLPYILWLAYATYLNLYIMLNN